MNPKVNAPFAHKPSREEPASVTYANPASVAHANSPPVASAFPGGIAHDKPLRVVPARPPTGSRAESAEEARARRKRDRQLSHYQRDRQQLMFDRNASPTTIQRGNAGEDRAAAYLETVGIRVVERNYKTKLGELDIIARDGDILVFVEVRTRSTRDFGQAIEMVNHDKQRRVTRVAWQYLKNRQPRFDIARFDVIGITAGELVHIKDAFRLG